MHKNRFLIILPVVLLAAATMGCVLGQSPGSPPTPFATPTIAPFTPTVASPPPTPTAAPPQITAVPAPPANELEAQVEAVYTQAGPAVVNITTSSTAYDFFMRPFPQEGAGSGFLYDAEGNIVTNYHVIENTESVAVTLAGGDTYPAQIVGTDPSNDLAVLHIDAENLPAPAPLGDSSQLRVGQFVVAIGNPFGLEQTLTVGVISSLGRIIESPDGRFIGEAIQTDAAINPGNSGGPLLDLQGRVIGVNSQIISPSQANAGIGFAVSANTVRRVVPELIANGHYPHPSLGVETASFEADGAALLREAGVDVPVEVGLLIINVVAGGPAEAAGLRGADRIVIVGNNEVPVGGDILVAVNGQDTTTFQKLNVYLEMQTRVGDTVEVTVWRGGQQMIVPVTLAELAR